MYLDNFLDGACEKINGSHSTHKKILEKILPLKSQSAPFSKESFVSKVSKHNLNETIAGVDSGFVSKRLSFIDLILVRVCGAIFSYKKSVLEKADYYPKAFSLPEPLLMKSALEKDEEQQSISLARLRKEVQASIEIIEKFHPKYLFIDGSIIPQYQDKPRADSKIVNDYNSIIDLFQKFYSTAEKNSCTLISCIEDSRGNRFKEILKEEVIKNSLFNPQVLDSTTDSSLLDYFLLEGERTFSFPYTSKISSHAILKDFDKKWSEKIHVFYLKASSLDLPLRVEFFSSAGKAEEIASVVFTLSSLQKEYSYPSVLIEADLRARLNEKDISVVYDRLIDKLGPKFTLRRNSRPFK
jgi:hypothetical protein